eukprot:19182-Pelagococcus_subviridis.AAC.1
MASHMSFASIARCATVDARFSGRACTASAAAQSSITGLIMSRRQLMIFSSFVRADSYRSSSSRFVVIIRAKRLSHSETNLSTSAPTPRGTCRAAAGERFRSLAAARRASSVHPSVGTRFIAAARIFCVRTCASSLSRTRRSRSDSEPEPEPEPEPESAAEDASCPGADSSSSSLGV